MSRGHPAAVCVSRRAGSAGVAAFLPHIESMEGPAARAGSWVARAKKPHRATCRRPVPMSQATPQGRRPKDWAEVQESTVRPLYEDLRPAQGRARVQAARCRLWVGLRARTRSGSRRQRRRCRRHARAGGARARAGARGRRSGGGPRAAAVRRRSLRRGDRVQLLPVRRQPRRCRRRGCAGDPQGRPGGGGGLGHPRRDRGKRIPAGARFQDAASPAGSTGARSRSRQTMPWER
jgi:hypothetical protein